MSLTISFYLWHKSLLNIAHTNFTMVKLWSSLVDSTQLRILSTTLSTLQLRNLNRMTCWSSPISFYLRHKSLLKIAHTNFTMVELWSCLLDSIQLRIFSTTLNTLQLRNLNRILYCLLMISFWMLHKSLLKIAHTNFTMVKLWSCLLNSAQLRILSMTLITLQLYNLNPMACCLSPISFWLLQKLLLKIAHTNFTMVKLWCDLLDSTQLRIFSTTLNTLQFHDLNPMTCWSSPISFYLWHKLLSKIVHTKFTKARFWSCLLDSNQLRIFSTTLNTLQLHNLDPMTCCLSPISFLVTFELSLNIAHTNFTMVELWSDLLVFNQLRIFTTTLNTLQLHNLNPMTCWSSPISFYLLHKSLLKIAHTNFTMVELWIDLLVFNQLRILSTTLNPLQLHNLNPIICLSLPISLWLLHKSLLNFSHTNFTMVKLWSCFLDSIQLRIFSTTLNTLQFHNLNPMTCWSSPISFYLLHKLLLKIVHTNFTMVELWSDSVSSNQLRILLMTLITLQLCNLNATIYLSSPILLWLDFQLHLEIAHTNFTMVELWSDLLVFNQLRIFTTTLNTLQLHNLNRMTCWSSPISFYLRHKSLLNIAHTNFTMARFWSGLLDSTQLRILPTTLNTVQLHNLNPVTYCLSPISFWLLQKLLLKIAHTNFTMVELWSCLLDSIQLRILSTSLTTLQLHNLNSIICLSLPISFYLWHKSLLNIAHTNFTMVKLWSVSVSSNQLRILSTTLNPLQLCNLDPITCLLSPISFLVTFELSLNIAHTNFTMV